MFDKTGTLTAGRPVVSDHWVAPGSSLEEVAALVGALEMETNHPLAGALVCFAVEALQLADVPLTDGGQARELLQQSLGLVAEGAETANGMGLSGKVSRCLAPHPAPVAVWCPCWASAMSVIRV